MCERCDGNHEALLHKPGCSHEVVNVRFSRSQVAYAVEIANRMKVTEDLDTRDVDILVRKALAFYVEKGEDVIGLNCAVERFVLERYRRDDDLYKKLINRGTDTLRGL